jgi:polysaccharide export outer membrane protein
MRILLALLIFGLCGSGAVAQTLKPGDTIEVSVYQDSKLDRRIMIPPGGMISFPLAGQVRAGGSTPQAVADALRSKLQKNFTDPLDITVSLVSVATREPIDDATAPRIYITGEVLRPGPYIIKVRTNVMQGISLAGGLGPFAAKQRIQVRRKVQGEDSIFVFDYYAYQSGQDTTRNIDLKSGDIIIVPERGLFGF